MLRLIYEQRLCSVQYTGSRHSVRHRNGGLMIIIGTRHTIIRRFTQKRPADSILNVQIAGLQQHGNTRSIISLNTGLRI